MSEPGNGTAGNVASGTDAGPTGAGAEAAEGLHGAREGAHEGERESAGEDARPGARDGGRAPAQTSEGDTGVREGGDRKGSEPLRHRDSTHEPGYGGKMGEPREEG